MDLFLWLGLMFATSLVLGLLFEKMKIPWLFAPLVLGIVANLVNIRPEHISNFNFLANLGMDFMLFIIGFKLGLEEFKKLGKEIIKDTLVINTAASIVGIIALLALSVSPIISLIAGIAIVTVGEEVLVPILDGFNLIKTKMGTMLIGIGVFDDIFEVTAIILAGTLVASASRAPNIKLDIVGILVPVILTLIFLYTDGVITRSRNMRKVEHLILIGLSLFFVYVAIANLAGAAGLGAILAGISLKNLVPNRYLEKTETTFDMISYVLFGPIFFAWVGMSLDLKSILVYPVLTGVLYIAPMLGKVFFGWLTTRNILGDRKAWSLGMGLSVRFSTQLVVAQLLFASKTISAPLFTAIVMSSAIATLVNPFLMIGMINHWGLYKNKA